MQKVLVVKAKPKIEQLLIDGDILIYKNTSAAENEIHWGDDFWTLHADFQEVKTMIDSELGNLQRDSGVHELSICFSSPNNFRKKILRNTNNTVQELGNHYALTMPKITLERSMMPLSLIG